MAGNWQIGLLTQAAQSPDTNTLDLSFFKTSKIDFGYLTLQSCLDEILCSNGGNTYSTPHMGKEKLLRAGTLPVRIRASPPAMSVARQILGLDGDGNGDDGE
jgi:hypothetical protein